VAEEVRRRSSGHRRMITIDAWAGKFGSDAGEFWLPSFEEQLWIPLHMDSRDSEDFWGRLHARDRAAAPGANISQAQNELRPSSRGPSRSFISYGAYLERRRGRSLIAGGHGTRRPPQATFAAVRGGIRAIDACANVVACCFRVSVGEPRK